ncbi:hypothetical protein [Sphingomonas sp.]|jgi:hypothetical protein|uniref:hypothetical protein n=1 Tax=Sphingomonas sp. TaxID=28214 RepID=UPI002EDB67CF
MSQHQPSDHQLEADRIQAAIRSGQAGERRPLFKPPPAAPQRSRNLLDQRLAEELEFVRRRLDAIGSIVANEPSLLMRHAASLQDLDHIDQTLGHIAKVIDAEDKLAAAERISLGDLKSRLQRRSAFPQ